jgi:hypothetical protein
VSEFTAIQGVSRTLQAILREHITNDPDPQLNGVPVDLRSPKEMRQANDTGISLWLYQVSRNEHLNNQQPIRPAVDLAPRKPLPVNLFYLVTPLRDIPDDEQALLGRVLQTFHDHNSLRGSDLRDSLRDELDELRVTLEQLSLEELTRIWHSLQEPYQLSVTYLVQVIRIDSAHDPLRTAPVVAGQADYSQVLGREKPRVQAGVAGPIGANGSNG